MKRTLLLAIVLVPAVTLGCAVDSGSSIGPEAATAASPVGAALAVDGVWNWSETTVLKLRPPALPLFGIQAEGPITTVQCHSSGQLTLLQAGSQISGSATQSSSCTTAGGVAFIPPAFPPGWNMTGELRGRSLSFTVDTGVFPCHYRGSIRVQGGAPTELQATGSCEVPGVLGNDKILGFSAARP